MGRGPSSVTISCGSPPVAGTSTGTISRSKRRSARALAALSCEATPKASVSSRPIPRIRAIRSAASNWLGESCRQPSLHGVPGPWRTFSPSGTRLT